MDRSGSTSRPIKPPKPSIKLDKKRVAMMPNLEPEINFTSSREPASKSR